MKFFQRFLLAVVVVCWTVGVLIAIQRTRLDLLTKHINPLRNIGVQRIVDHQNDTALEVTKEDKFYNSEIKRLAKILEQPVNHNMDVDPFAVAAGWVQDDQLYPHHHPELLHILNKMVTSKIVSADVLPKGTQIKLLLILEGGQRVVFKQKRYERDFIIEGKPYEGYDRHNAEIAAFHLDRILDYRRAPIVVGRTLNLKTEIMPVASAKLLETFQEKDGNLCYYGKCLYCKEEHIACAQGDIMEGALTLWLPEKWSSFDKLRHPYQRTYVDNRKAKWEMDEGYCDNTVKLKEPFIKGRRLLDVTDGAVFDFLIGNADRHHYEIFKGTGNDGMMLMMDNAKSFGNPYENEESILAPITQCCILRNSTWTRMNHLKGGLLTKLLETILHYDPIHPVLDKPHYIGIETRLLIILDKVNECIDKRGLEHVIVDSWDGIK